MKEHKGCALINGPVSKKHFLKKKFPGITEYLASKTGCSGKEVMLIYNNNLSVSPITTHLQLKSIFKKITIKKITKQVITINKFYKRFLNKIPKIAITGLNPHCESINNKNEEKKIINPAIKILLKKKVKIFGAFAADTLFIKKNVKKFDVIIGMYHDQVLTPIKTLYEFKAINVTLGLPFIRISPDHGPNNQMLGQNKSDPNSLQEALNFLNRIRAN
jgi:4-hydroxythreonine-4-phosphate dehydrogenase